MMYVFVLALFASAMSERVHVVTPQSRLSEDGETATQDDSYVKAYREIRDTVRERRNPLGSYAEDYNTLSHSSFIEDDVYPELNYKTTEHRKPHHQHHHHEHQHPPPLMYGPPTPISHHHHHHPEHISSHHTLIDFPSPIHLITAFLHKFGLHKVVKIIAKIAVLKVILKFVTVIALFLVIPALIPAQDKEKEDSDDDSLLKSLNVVTDRVWNGITVREKIEVLDHQENHQNQQQIQHNTLEIHQKPTRQTITHHPDKDNCKDEDGEKCKDMCKDMDKDKCKEKDKCKDKDEDKCMDKDKCKDKDKGECKEKDKNMNNDKCKEKENEKDKNKNKHKDKDELDDVNRKLLNKVIKQWKEENFGGPDKSSAISFLRNCVTTANRILGILLGYLKMKHGNMDVLDGMMFNRFSIYMKHLVKIWPNIFSGWKG